MGPVILPETTVGKHNLLCHLQMPTKALSCKKEAICEHGPEALSCPVGQGSFKMGLFQNGKAFYGQTISSKDSISDGMAVHKFIRYKQ